MGNVDSWRKSLKVFAIAMMIVDVLLIVLGALVAASVVDPYWLVDEAAIEAAQATGAMGVFVTMVGVATVVAGAIQLVCTAFVYRGAKDPSKMKPGMILYGLLSVYEVCSLFTAGLGGGELSVSIAVGLVTFVIFAETIIVYRSAKKN